MEDPKRKAYELLKKANSKQGAMLVVDEVLKVLFLDEIVSLDSSHSRVVDFWEDVKKHLNE